MELPTVITNYLDGLTDVEQDRVLTTPLSGYGMSYKGGHPKCLVMAVNPGISADIALVVSGCDVPNAFDRLCAESQDAEAGAAIRDYICELRADRGPLRVVLRGSPHTRGVTV